MIDGATSDEDKVAPVYKLEEICELLRSSHFSIVKEVSEFILKRLDHKSPLVKQKALRLIKYSVGKSGAEFRREMQRHSVAVRQLLHYRGHPDPLKGDALNKAVRETAQEALSAIFSTEESNRTPAENLNKRIEGFGNTNYDMPYEEKKSFLTEVVEIGSASIKQGLSTLAQSHSMKKNDDGSYRGPTLRRSLTNETNHPDRYDRMEYSGASQSSGISKNASSGPWGQGSGMNKVEASNGESSSGYPESKTREERLLETIVTSGGVRLQPTRDALQAFLGEASKLDSLALSHALASKLQSPLWQVRVKAVCVLEAILRKKDDEHFAVVASYFIENIEIMVRCSESPQASLREKSNKVLCLLGGEHTKAAASPSEGVSRAETSKIIEMPDLIDTGNSDDLLGEDDSSTSQIEHNIAKQPTSASPLIDDLFRDGVDTGASISEQKTDDDPFADVSFHTSDDKEQGADLFAGMNVGDRVDAAPTVKTSGSDPFDIFGSSSELPIHQENHKTDVNNLMAGLTINQNGSELNLKGVSAGPVSDSIFAESKPMPASQASNNPVNGSLDSQVAAMNANPMFTTGSVPYNLPPGLMFNQAFYSQPLNYATMGGFLSQQQLLAAMGNLQQLGNLNPQNAGVVTSGANGDASALPDIFNANMPNTATTMMNSSKKEDTKAFDFILDHLAAARDPKRVL